MSGFLMKRTVVPGMAYAVTDVDSPRGTVLALALRCPDGWKVASAEGLIGTGLEQRQASKLMVKAALAAAARRGSPLISRAASTPAEPVPASPSGFPF